jgi:hypothetical protein
MKHILVLLVFLFLTSCSSDPSNEQFKPPRYQLEYQRSGLSAKTVSVVSQQKYLPDLGGWSETNNILARIGFNHRYENGAIAAKSLLVKVFEQRGKKSLGAIKTTGELIVAPPMNDIKLETKDGLYFQREAGQNYFFLDMKTGMSYELPFSQMKYTDEAATKHDLVSKNYVIGTSCSETSCTAYRYLSTRNNLVAFENVSRTDIDNPKTSGPYPVDIVSLNFDEFYIVRHAAVSGADEYFQPYQALNNAAMGEKLHDLIKTTGDGGQYQVKVEEGLYRPLFYPASNFLGFRVEEADKISDELYKTRRGYVAVVKVPEGVFEIAIQDIVRSNIMNYFAKAEYIELLRPHFQYQVKNIGTEFMACQKHEKGEWVLSHYDGLDERRNSIYCDTVDVKSDQWQDLLAKYQEKTEQKDKQKKSDAAYYANKRAQDEKKAKADALKDNKVTPYSTCMAQAPEQASLQYKTAVASGQRPTDGTWSGTYKQILADVERRCQSLPNY